MLYYNKIDVSEGIDINKQAHLKNVLLVTIGIFYIKDLGFNQLDVMMF